MIHTFFERDSEICGKQVFVFPRISESSLAFQRSCGSLGPFTENTTKPRRPARGSRSGPPANTEISRGSGIPPPGSPLPAGGHRRAGFLREVGFRSQRDFPRCSGTGFTDLQNSALLGFLRRGRGKRFFPSPGRGKQVFPPNFKVFPSLSKKLWIAGSLHKEGRRSPDAPRAGVGKWAPGFFPLPGSGIPLLGSPESGIFAEVGEQLPASEIPPAGSGIPPPGSPGSRLREAGFSPARVKCRGLRVTPFYIVPHGWQGFLDLWTRSAGKEQISKR